MTSLNAFDRQCLADILHREGAAAVLSELAWLLAETDMAKLLLEQRADQKASDDLDRSASTLFLSSQTCSARGRSGG